MRFLSPLFAILSLFSVGGCRQNSDRPIDTNLPEASQPEAAAAPAPQLPSIEPPLTRRDLLLAAVEAASSAATRTDDGEQQRALDGRAFSLRIRFCPGDAMLSQQFDPKARVLKVKVTPDVDPSSLGPAADPGGEVTGFWLPRPWMLTAVCPTQQAGSAQPTQLPAEGEAADGIGEASPAATDSSATPARRVGLLEVLRPDDPRIGRDHQRNYAITKRLDEGEQPGTVELVVQGRLRAMAGGKVIRCDASATNAPPRCLISVTMDRVRLEDTGGKLLAEWSNS